LLRKLNTLLSAYRHNGLAGIKTIIGRKLLGATQVDASDEYTTWLGFANAGMLQPGNLYCFDYAIKNLPSDAPIIEIGSFCGLSANLITYYKQKHGKTNKLLTCDRWDFENQRGELIGASTIPHTEYREFVKETYCRNVRFFSRDDLPFTIELFSDEFFAAWRSGKEVQDVFGRSLQLGGRISFAFIDGNHSFEFAKRDFENCDEFLESGGFILFDDSADGTDWDVCKIVKDIQAMTRYKLVIKNPNYLFQKE